MYIQYCANHEQGLVGLARLSGVDPLFVLAKQDLTKDQLATLRAYLVEAGGNELLQEDALWQFLHNLALTETIKGVAR